MSVVSQIGVDLVCINILSHDMLVHAMMLRRGRGREERYPSRQYAGGWALLGRWTLQEIRV